MRVCFLTTVLDPYKGANHLPLLAALPSVTFIIVCNRSKVPQEELPSNVEVIALGGRIGPYYYGIADFLFARRILQKFPVGDAFWSQFDVLHCNQIMGPALRRLSRTRVPLVLTIHHPVTVDRAIAVEEANLLEGVQWRIKYALLIRFQRAMAHTADRVMTVSQTVRERLIHDYQLDPGKIIVISNGVNGDAFAPDDSPPLYDVVSIGAFIHPRKGFRYLLQAYRRLAKEGVRIADVGRRTDEQTKAMQEIPGLTVHGTVSEDRLRELLRRSSALLSTSLYEGFGLSLIEALACGRPAFAFAAGAVPEVLAPIDAELVVPIRDVDALSDKVIAFLRLSQEERNSLGEKYRESVLKLYALERSAAGMYALYQTLQKDI